VLPRSAMFDLAASHFVRPLLPPSGFAAAGERGERSSFSAAPPPSFFGAADEVVSQAEAEVEAKQAELEAQAAAQ